LIGYRTVGLPLPEPPLAGKRCRLRSWEPGDALALAAAWSDPEVRRWLPVPEDVDPAAAAAWIAGEAGRRQAGLALDLVAVEPVVKPTPEPTGDPAIGPKVGGEVLGEVGLSAFDPERGAARIGWWTVAAQRRRGIATEMVRILTAWALGPPLGLAVLVAEVENGNVGSLAVASAAGYEELGRSVDGRVVMASRSVQESVRRV
jgi:RimJ/RimL family protein N-acetyltransferase